MHACVHAYVTGECARGRYQIYLNCSSLYSESHCVGPGGPATYYIDQRDPPALILTKACGTTPGLPLYFFRQGFSLTLELYWLGNKL